MTSLATDVGPAPMQVGAILVLDTPDGFDPFAGRTAIAERARSIPRLRQRLRRVPFGCGRPIWVDDEEFDVARHVFIADGSTGRSRAEAYALAADLVASRLPGDRPLWSATFVPNVESGQAALVFVFHHVLTDGVGGLAVLAGLVDGLSDGPVSAFPRPAPSALQLVLDAARARLRSVTHLPLAPQRLRAALDELRAAGRVRASRSSLNRPIGPRREIAVASTDLTRIRDVAHAHGGTVNDVVLSAVGGALRTLLESRGEEVDHFVVSVPVSRRRAATATDLGNQVGISPIELPSIADRTERLRVVTARGARVREAPRGASSELVGPVFRALARVGCFRWLIDRQRVVNSFVTNLRGPETRLTFLSAPISELLPVTGIAGNVTVAFAVLSYAGRLGVTIVADPDACEDLNVIRDALQEELDEHARLRSA